MFNDWKLLIIFKKSSTLDATGVQFLLLFYSSVVLVYNVNVIYFTTLNIEKAAYLHFDDFRNGDKTGHLFQNVKKNSDVKKHFNWQVFATV